MLRVVKEEAERPEWQREFEGTLVNLYQTFADPQNGDMEKMLAIQSVALYFKQCAAVSAICLSYEWRGHEMELIEQLQAQIHMAIMGKAGWPAIQKAAHKKAMDILEDFYWYDPKR